jgi:hypothetical protein
MLTIASELHNNQQELARLARSEGIFERDCRASGATNLAGRCRPRHGQSDRLGFGPMIVSLQGFAASWPHRPRKWPPVIKAANVQPQ